MGTNECSQPAPKSSWDSRDFGDVNMVLKIAHFHKSTRPWVNLATFCWQKRKTVNKLINVHIKHDIIFQTKNPFN